MISEREIKQKPIFLFFAFVFVFIVGRSTPNSALSLRSLRLCERPVFKVYQSPERSERTIAHSMLDVRCSSFSALQLFPQSSAPCTQSFVPRPSPTAYILNLPLSYKKVFFVHKDYRMYPTPFKHLDKNVIHDIF